MLGWRECTKRIPAVKCLRGGLAKSLLGRPGPDPLRELTQVGRRKYTQSTLGLEYTRGGLAELPPRWPDPDPAQEVRWLRHPNFDPPQR